MPINQLFEQEHSEEVQEIIGAVPGWILRWGISLFFVILLMILLFAGLIKSPEIIPARLRVDAENRPQEVLARQEGKLTKLFVREDQLVKKGEVLGYLESNADHGQVLSLSQRIDQLQMNVLTGDPHMKVSFELKPTTHYGELQPALQEFYLAYLKFLNYTPGGVYQLKEQALRREIDALRQLETQLIAQQKVNQEEFVLAKDEFERHRALMEANVISLQEFTDHERKFLSSKLPLHSTRSSLINNSISQEQKRGELMEIAHEKSNERVTFLSKLQRFQSEIDSWKKEHVLFAEQSGRVIFHQVLKENQWVKLNKPILYISNAIKDVEPFGELLLGQQSFGKIKRGQDVLIRLNAYPSQEFGLLRGKVTYLSDVVSGDTVFTATVRLPSVTTYGKKVNLRTGLVAQAEVVTGEQSLLGRFFNSTRDIFVNR
ncbi:HlyD family secretion protein [Pontibacter sp. MBLB2868]|uniref:HlyD family secretion protein n=1 Tax=Pontibacter sp. MBLB2868 TaxID=3451555 RepID=UPI003F752124